ncbi:uncharacterized protein EDB91DRAFT_1246524 [Suillus paluster]|uniref:uncharacterized protein n=1 Tax=Suillus paluster TaxID=48578 RepID=UPI001B874E26|nr:uncharacterized protein EDB91DRAFT_1246524 [Suillus paluster]KAG1745007.1 hypothetical protein EDB91DRAFT_1246524 [Suillus paluster]
MQSKGDYTGIRKTKDWAEKLATSKLLRPSITNVTSASTNPGPPPTPAHSVRESDTSLLDDDDSLEHKAAYNATKKTQTGDSARCTTSDVVKVSSLLSLHTSRPVCVPSQKMAMTESWSSPPPCTQPSRVTTRLPGHPELMSDLSMELYEFGDTEEAEDEALSAPVAGKGIKRLTTSTDVGISSNAPASKRAKTESHITSI